MSEHSQPRLQRWTRGVRFLVWGLLLVPLLANGQPILEEITPLPGHDVLFVTRNITEQTGLWTVVSQDSGIPYFWQYNTRPYYSTNGGDTWELRDSGIPSTVGVLAVHPNPQNPDLLWAETTTIEENVGPWRSTDRGLTWSPAMENIASEGRYYCQTGWFADGIHAWCQIGVIQWFSYYYVSADSGATWDSLGSIDNTGWAEWFTHPSISGLLLRSSAWPIPKRTTNFGYTWISCETNSLWGFSDYCVGMSPSRVYGIGLHYTLNPPQFFCFIAVSQDTGFSWHLLNPQDTLLPSDQQEYWRGLLSDPTQAGHLFMTTRDSVFESTNEGQTWIGLEGRQNQFYYLGFDNEHRILYVGGPYYELTGVVQGGLWRLDLGTSVGPQPREQGEAEVRVTIFPNPATDVFQLHLSSSRAGVWSNTISLYNLLGQLVWSRDLIPVTAGNMQSYVLTLPDNLAGGVYFLAIQGNNQLQYQKIFINR